MKNNSYIRTYGRTRGRKRKISIVNYQNKLENYLFDSMPTNKDVIVDIGSGNGENTIKLSENNPDKLIIACDVYLDGNASLIKKLHSKNCNNVKLFEKNCLFLFKLLKKFSLNDIWILYPDPWPKKKHYKRRLINISFIKILYSVLKDDGKIYIATDNKNYFFDILLKFNESKLFFWQNDRPFYWIKPFKKMAETSYFLKAKKNNQKSNFMIFKKKI